MGEKVVEGSRVGVVVVHGWVVCAVFMVNIAVAIGFSVVIYVIVVVVDDVICVVFCRLCLEQLCHHALGLK